MKVIYNLYKQSAAVADHAKGENAAVAPATGREVGRKIERGQREVALEIGLRKTTVTKTGRSRSKLRRRTMVMAA